MSRPDTVLDVLQRYATERREASLVASGDGGAKDYAQYRESVGYIRALGEVIREIKELRRKVEEYE
jgi:AAA+ ATPase superfamily predicted ATPase